MNTQYGFDWDQVSVTRMAEFKGTKVVEVRSGNHNLQISVSPTGRSIRVWRDGKELA